ncbi:unnamed protein product [Sympodiomycopsis kandeliae]
MSGSCSGLDASASENESNGSLSATDLDSESEIDSSNSEESSDEEDLVTPPGWAQPIVEYLSHGRLEPRINQVKRILGAKTLTFKVLAAHLAIDEICHSPQGWLHLDTVLSGLEDVDLTQNGNCDAIPKSVGKGSVRHNFMQHCFDLSCQRLFDRLSAIFTDATSNTEAVKSYKAALPKPSAKAFASCQQSWRRIRVAAAQSSSIVRAASDTIPSNEHILAATGQEPIESTRWILPLMISLRATALELCMLASHEKRLMLVMPRISVPCTLTSERFDHLFDRYLLSTSGDTPNDQQRTKMFVDHVAMWGSRWDVWKAFCEDIPFMDFSHTTYVQEVWSSEPAPVHSGANKPSKLLLMPPRFKRWQVQHKYAARFEYHRSPRWDSRQKASLIRDARSTGALMRLREAIALNNEEDRPAPNAPASSAAEVGRPSKIASLMQMSCFAVQQMLLGELVSGNDANILPRSHISKLLEGVSDLLPATLAAQVREIYPCVSCRRLVPSFVRRAESASPRSIAARAAGFLAEESSASSEEGRLLGIPQTMEGSRPEGRYKIAIGGLGYWLDNEQAASDNKYLLEWRYCAQCLLSHLCPPAGSRSSLCHCALCKNCDK